MMRRIVSSRRRVAAAGALLSLSVLAACGPSSPLDVGVRHDGAPVFLGVTPQPSPSLIIQPPHADIVPNFPAPLIAPPAPPVAPVEAVSPCPTPQPGAVPKDAAGSTATQPPVAATYNFRYVGTDTFNPSASNQKTVLLPTSGTRQVTNVSPPASDGHYTFDVVEQYNNMTTTVSYLDEPNGGSPTRGTTASGLYLSAMTTVDSKNRKSTFAPTSPVELMPFPATPGAQFQSAGVDPLHQTTMDEDQPGGQVGNHERINTCGDVVDTWHVEITGHILNYGGVGTTTFDITFNVATQYGGLLVAQHTVENGTDQDTNQPYTYDVTDTIDSVPSA